MTKAIIITATEHFVACPHCGVKAGRVDHLFSTHLPRSFGPWSCQSCRMSYSGTVHAPDNIELEKRDEAYVRTIDLLALEMGDAEPILFLVGGGSHRNGGKRAGSDDDGKEYLYEEHTCPTNITQSIVRIIEGDDDDPHGLFTYLATVDWPDGLEEHEINIAWALEHFPEYFDGGGVKRLPARATKKPRPAEADLG